MDNLINTYNTLDDKHDIINYIEDNYFDNYYLCLKEK